MAVSKIFSFKTHHLFHKVYFDLLVLAVYFLFTVSIDFPNNQTGAGSFRGWIPIGQ